MCWCRSCFLKQNKRPLPFAIENRSKAAEDGEEGAAEAASPPPKKPPRKGKGKAGRAMRVPPPEELGILCISAVMPVNPRALAKPHWRLLKNDAVVRVNTMDTENMAAAGECMGIGIHYWVSYCHCCSLALAVWTPTKTIGCMC